MLDFSKAFDLINHEKLLVKLKTNDVPPHKLRCMGSVRLDRTQQVNIGKTVSSVGNPNGGVPRALYQAIDICIMFINDLTTIAPIYKYVHDSKLFEGCQEGDNTQIQESVDSVYIYCTGAGISKTDMVLCLSHSTSTEIRMPCLEYKAAKLCIRCN